MNEDGALRSDAVMQSRVNLNNEVKFWAQYFCEFKDTGAELKKSILFYRGRHHYYIKSPRFMPHQERLMIYNKYVYHFVDPLEIQATKQIVGQYIA
jgi:hypothetical protein